MLLHDNLDLYVDSVGGDDVSPSHFVHAGSDLSSNKYLHMYISFKTWKGKEFVKKMDYYL